ncbi:MAG: RNA polymerase sigma factor [Cytophagales bacterium]|nr:RNA polymerase sigma factor [Cytophagales bacterium]
MRASVSDTELIREHVEGNGQAFSELYNKYNERVFNKILFIVKDPDVAGDLSQEVFVKAYHTVNSGNYNEEGKFLPWIMRIAHNRAIDWFRRSRRYPTVSVEENPNLFDTSDFMELTVEDLEVKGNVIAKLKNMIEELPEAQKIVLKMRSYMGMSFQEIADETGVSVNTALGRMRYALINLRKRMDSSDEQVLALVA